jgi:hypothetical protein
MASKCANVDDIAQHSRLIMLAFAGPDPPHTILVGKRDVIR